MFRLGMFKEHVVNALTNGIDELYCSEMSLIQDAEVNPISYHGPGYLRRDPNNKQITFKIFSMESQNTPVYHVLPLALKAGQLLGNNCFFRLSATDEYGQIWHGERIRPNLHGLQRTESVHANCHIIVGGSVKELKSISQWSSEPENIQVLILRIPGTADIPFNDSTETITTIAGGNEQKHWKLNISKFSASGWNFLIEKKEAFIQIEVSSERPFPPHFDVRVIESLQFVLGRIVHWGTLAYWNNEILTIRLSSSPPILPSTRFKPPITEQYARVLGSQHFYSLFEKYLQFVCKSEDEEWHACSKLLHQAIQSGSNSIQLVALGLGVVVEGFVKEFFEEYKADSASLDTAILELMSNDEIWEKLPGWKDKDFRQKRIAKALKSLRRTSTADRLYNLAQIGAIERRLVDRWKEVRHPAAHGVSLGGDLQNTLDAIHAVNTLIYQIIFSLINYQGFFVDFSKHGHPHASYPPKPES